MASSTQRPPLISQPLPKPWVARRGLMVGAQSMLRSAVFRALRSTVESTADGSTSMTIIDVATRFADPSLGFASLGLKLPMLSFFHEERFIRPG